MTSINGMGRRSYRITVGGRLSERFGHTFNGVVVIPGSGETVLHGALDQAQLHGVLQRVRDLGLELLRVEEATP